MNKNGKIIRSAIITPDNTYLESFSRHDFKIYKDTITNKEYGIDGGTDYQRYIGDVYEDCKIILVNKNEKFDIIRNKYYWGTRGKNGKEKLKFKKLSELSNEHINNILKTQKQLNNYTKNFFIEELKFRENEKIFIND